jgi:hypothetical protein
VLLALLNCPVETGQRPLDDPTANRREIKAFSLHAFPKIAPSSLPNRRVHSRMRIPPLSRRSLRPSPVSCYASWMFQPCGFTPLRRLSPRRSCPRCCSGSRPWGSSSFHRSSTHSFESATFPDSRDVSLPFEAFPPPIAVVAGWHSRLIGPAFPCGEAHASCPTVTPLCCTCVSSAVVAARCRDRRRFSATQLP